MNKHGDEVVNKIYDYAPNGEDKDNPKFKGVYDFSKMCTGGTIDCAHLIMG